MKWREPWLESMKTQPPFRPFGRRVVRGFLIWSLAFAALVGISALGKDVSMHDMARWLRIVLAGAAVISLLLYATWWLSPRRIESGPRGIVVSKADELFLIPWTSIASTAVLPGRLRITLGNGDVHTLLLPRHAPISEIEAEILERRQ